MFPNFATERENHKAAVTCSALETSEVAVGPGPARKFPSHGSPPKVSPVPIQERSRRERTWLELLKEVAPRVTRIGVVRKDIIAAGIGQLATIQSIAQSFGVDLSVPSHSDIFAVGDTAAGTDQPGIPGTAPPAKLMGRYADRLIAARVDGAPSPPPFVCPPISPLTMRDPPIEGANGPSHPQ